MARLSNTTKPTRNHKAPRPLSPMPGSASYTKTVAPAAKKATKPKPAKKGKKVARPEARTQTTTNGALRTVHGKPAVNRANAKAAIAKPRRRQSGCLKGAVSNAFLASKKGNSKWNPQQYHRWG